MAVVAGEWWWWWHLAGALGYGIAAGVSLARGLTHAAACAWAQTMLGGAYLLTHATLGHRPVVGAVLAAAQLVTVLGWLAVIQTRRHRRPLLTVEREATDADVAVERARVTIDTLLRDPPDR